MTTPPNSRASNAELGLALSRTGAPTADDLIPSPGSEQTSQPGSPKVEREIPTLANTLLFFLLAVGITLVLGLASIGVAQALPGFRHQDMRSLALDARVTIPSQAVEYLALLGATALLFRNLWGRPFWQAIRWNTHAATRRWLVLLATGLALGLLNGAGSNLLPMPKEAPILTDLMKSTTGAWLMFLFGTTLAPLLEELAFRGFLLPSLINFFRWITRPKHLLYAFGPDTSDKSPSPLIVPGAILLTSLLFALLHGEQVAGAWAPLLLIGAVSVVLCIVRLWTQSLAASALVHATYNFTLFAGMLIASDGFRHLDKLNN